jgi:hypothetical protein
VRMQTLQYQSRKSNSLPVMLEAKLFKTHNLAAKPEHHRLRAHK